MSSARGEPDERPPTSAEIRWLLLLDDAADAVPSRRMEDASLADPERDVIGALRGAVRDEVSGSELGFGEPLARLLLLVRVARDETPAGPEGHVHEPGAVDPGRGHPTPLVARAEQRSRVLERLGRDRPEPRGVAIASQIPTTCPARIRVRRLDVHPLARVLEHAQLLAGQGLRDLLGVGPGSGTERGELACERMFA